MQPLNLTNNTEGEIFLHDERVIITSSSIFGTLRKELVENIGHERTKGFLLRYGWNLGANDARKALKQEKTELEGLLRQGPVFHAMQGYTKAVTTNLKVERDRNGNVKSVQVKGIWINSYEADAYKEQTGYSNEPVCHTLIGYASGFYSTICGQKIIFREVACKSSGVDVCHYEGKSYHLWEEEIQKEAAIYHSETIVQELEDTYEKLVRERNHLSKVMKLHTSLTEELVNGHTLQSVADIGYQITGLPILIENRQTDEIYCAGFPSYQIKMVKELFKHAVSKGSLESLAFGGEVYKLISAPIMLKRKIYGICAFVYPAAEERDWELDKSVIARVSTVSSIYILNEKASYESLERVRGLFLDQILNKNFSSGKEIVEKSHYYKVKLGSIFTMVVIKFESKNRENDYFALENVMEAIYLFLRKERRSILAAHRNGHIVLMIMESKSHLMNLLERCLSFLKQVHPEYAYSIGYSSESTIMEDAHHYYEEALTAIRMNQDVGIHSFQDIDLMGILIHTGTSDLLLNRAKKLLSPLLGENLKKKELLKTLYTFLLCGGNLEKIMDELALSMSGLRYRLRKIEELLQCDLRNPRTAFQLYASIEALMNVKVISIED